MGQAYQDEVGDNLDYHLQQTPYGFRVRGPINFQDTSLENSISFIGAAQPFGVWCEFPYPTLVANALSPNCFNLGHGGAGPRAFLSDPRVIHDLNKTKACVVQVMSGRSVGNRYMKQHNGTCVVTLQHPHLPSEKLLAHLITQLAPRRADWAHRLVLIYQAGHVAQCHPFPERSLPA